MVAPNRAPTVRKRVRTRVFFPREPAPSRSRLGLVRFRIWTIRLITCDGLFADHPRGITLNVGFLFPNRQALFELVDDVSASGKRLRSVLGGDTDPHRALPDLNFPHAVKASYCDDVVFIERLLDEPLALLLCKGAVGLVFQKSNRPPIV